MVEQEKVNKGRYVREFPGGPVVRTPRFHCRGLRFHPWFGELRPHKLCGVAKREKKKKKGGGMYVNIYF